MILDHFSKINIGLGLITLVCFFLPWINVGCGNVTIVRLSGFDLATGRIVLDEDAMQQLSAEAERTGRNLNPLEQEHQTQPQLYLVVVVMCSLGMIGYGVRMFQELNRVGIFAIGAFGAFALLVMAFAAAKDFGVDLPADVARIVHIAHGSGFYLTTASFLGSIVLSVVALRATSETAEETVTIDLPINKAEILPEEIESLDLPETASDAVGTNAFGEPVKLSNPGTVVAPTAEPEARCPSCGTPVKVSQATCGQCSKVLSGAV